jgi:hypothetical protein
MMHAHFELSLNQELFSVLKFQRIDFSESRSQSLLDILPSFLKLKALLGITLHSMYCNL